MTWRRIAVHEAAHALAAHSRGLEVTLITLQPSGAGGTHYMSNNDPDTVAFVSAAGRGATEAFGYGDAGASRDDLRQIAPAAIPGALELARAFASRNRAQIDRLADCLVAAGGMLAGPALVAALEALDG